MISCYWCPDCWQHLACLLLSGDKEKDQPQFDRLDDLIENHKEVCKGVPSIEYLGNDKGANTTPEA